MSFLSVRWVLTPVWRDDYLMIMVSPFFTWGYGGIYHGGGSLDLNIFSVCLCLQHCAVFKRRLFMYVVLLFDYSALFRLDMFYFENIIICMFYSLSATVQHTYKNADISSLLIPVTAQGKVPLTWILYPGILYTVCSHCNKYLSLQAVEYFRFFILADSVTNKCNRARICKVDLWMKIWRWIILFWL